MGAQVRARTRSFECQTLMGAQSICLQSFKDNLSVHTVRSFTPRQESNCENCIFGLVYMCVRLSVCISICLSVLDGLSPLVLRNCLYVRPFHHPAALGLYGHIHNSTKEIPISITYVVLFAARCAAEWVACCQNSVCYTHSGANCPPRYPCLGAAQRGAILLSVVLGLMTNGSRQLSRTTFYPHPRISWPTAKKHLYVYYICTARS